MEPRIDYRKIAPDGISALSGLENYVRQSDLDPALLELVKLRASQLNGCAYCIDMHTKDARAGGESEQRLYAVAVWRETPFFTERERAALAWTEAVTQVSHEHVPEGVYEFAHRLFSDKELVDLTLAIIAINGWNRLAISFRSVPGTYQPALQSRVVGTASRESESASGQVRNRTGNISGGPKGQL
jgi:AhpD family alkylhydroperoxidase